MGETPLVEPPITVGVWTMRWYWMWREVTQEYGRWCEVRAAMSPNERALWDKASRHEPSV